MVGLDELGERLEALEAREAVVREPEGLEQREVRDDAWRSMLSRSHRLTHLSTAPD